jgi:hypothetical protein
MPSCGISAMGAVWNPHATSFISSTILNDMGVFPLVALAMGAAYHLHAVSSNLIYHPKNGGLSARDVQ